MIKRVEVNTKALQKFVANLKPSVAAAVNRANNTLESVAQQLAPEKTGRLRRSIHKSRRATPASPVATTVADAEYAVYVELGFHHWQSGEFIPGQPYMQPAYEMAKRQLISELSDLAKGKVWVTETDVPAFGGGNLLRGPGGRFVGRKPK